MTDLGAIASVNDLDNASDDGWKAVTHFMCYSSFTIARFLGWRCTRKCPRQVCWIRCEAPTAGRKSGIWDSNEVTRRTVAVSWRLTVNSECMENDQNMRTPGGSKREVYRTSLCS